MEQFYSDIRHGNLVAVEAVLDENPELLDQPQTLSGEDRRNRTPLLAASHYGKLEIVNLLLDRGSKAVTIPDGYGSFPIHWAAQEGHLPIVERLLATLPPEEISSHLLTVNTGGRTPLWYALKHNQGEMIELLFRRSPTAIFVIDTDARTAFGVNGSTQDTKIKLLQLGIETFPSDRMKELLISTVSSRITHQEMKFEFEIWKFDPSIIQSLPRSQILNGLFTSNPVPAFFYHLIPFLQPTSSEILKLMAYTIRVGLDQVFQYLSDHGIEKYGLDWLDSNLLQPIITSQGDQILLEVAITFRNHTILNSLIWKYLQLAKNDFARGQLYAYVIGKNYSNPILYQLVENAQSIQLAIYLLNRLAGPSFTWEKLSCGRNSPLVTACFGECIKSIILLLRIGCSVTELIIELAQSRPNIRPIFAAMEEGEFDGTMEEKLGWRHRIYFDSSLLDRLLCWCE